MIPTEMQRLAHAINALRPDWPVPSLTSFLNSNLASRAYRDTAVALAYVACDPTTRTPARALEAGPWWTTAADKPATTVPGIITRCEHGQVSGTCRICSTVEPVPADVASKYAAMAREAARLSLASTHAPTTTTGDRHE